MDWIMKLNRALIYLTLDTLSWHWVWSNEYCKTIKKMYNNIFRKSIQSREYNFLYKEYQIYEHKMLFIP